MHVLVCGSCSGASSASLCYPKYQCSWSYVDIYGNTYLFDLSTMCSETGYMVRQRGKQHSCDLCAGLLFWVCVRQRCVSACVHHETNVN